MKRTAMGFLLALASMLAIVTAARAQLIPAWVGSLVNGMTTMSADPASTQEELPGMGHKFQLLFGMDNAQDPRNPTNDTIAVVTSPTVIGAAVRDLPPGIKIAALTDQIQLKYLFPELPRTCAGGSPRFQLAVDTDGDGRSNGNAFGYVGHAPFGAGCVTGTWDFIDMANLDDPVGRWDLTQFAAPCAFTCTWSQVVTFFNLFPAHQVLSGSLVDDSGSFAAGAVGLAHYDLITIENRTLENRQDTVK